MTSTPLARSSSSPTPLIVRPPVMSHLREVTREAAELAEGLVLIVLYVVFSLWNARIAPRSTLPPARHGEPHA